VYVYVYVYVYDLTCMCPPKKCEWQIFDPAQKFGAGSQAVVTS